MTEIAGPHWLLLTFEGTMGHAGNTPMNDRQDALVAASEFVFPLNQIPCQINRSSVATVGKLSVEPNGVNVIPGKVTLYVDILDIQEESREELVERILQLSGDFSKKHHVQVSHEHLLVTPPVPIAEERQKRMKEALETNGIRPFYLPSGAGHDSQVVGKELPVAMLFVRSKDGISHNPAEWTDLNDCVQAVQILKIYPESLQK